MLSAGLMEVALRMVIRGIVGVRVSPCVYENVPALRSRYPPRFRGGSQSKHKFDPTPFRHGYVSNTSCKAGIIGHSYSHQPDRPAVVAMQARKWPTCSQGRYVQHFQVMSTSLGIQLTTLAVEPISYMAKALAEPSNRRKRAGTPDF
jgi:hypothetical protein